MSDFPPPPPPVAPPPSEPPTNSATDRSAGPKRKKLWIWLAAAVVVLVGVGIAANAGKKDDGDSVSPASTEDESADATLEATSPRATDSTSIETGQSAPVTEPIEQTTPETVAASSDVVAGAPVGLHGDRSNPVAVGEIADIGDGWRLQILNVNADAAAVISAENQFNDPPPAGSTFTLVTVALGYFGLEDPKTTFETTISAVGASNVELVGSCGVVPQELSNFGDVFSGGVVQGNICFVTTPEDAASLQVYGTSGFFGGDPVFIDASKPPTAAVPMTPVAGPQAGAASTPDRLAPTAIGTAGDIGEGWQLTVTGPAADITDAVHAENQFNDPPPDGSRFIGVPVTYTYGGTGSASPFSVTADAVGDGNVSLSKDCGVTPGEFDSSADVFTGGSVSGTLCFVAPADSPSFVIYATAGFSGDSVMFAAS
ncbi:MAG TPA: hypothetical protein VHQ23_18590, partial [Ilumatobacteraceae bacterium]|nr:hypothetical protein [Ilumatobacteraceae bacterium]